MKLIFILILAGLLSACNAVAGAGRDITSSSEWVKGKISGGGTSKESAPKPAPAKEAPASATSTQPSPAAPATQTNI